MSDHETMKIALIGATGKLVDAGGKSSISYEDYAVALVDGLENPQHLRRRFTVGY